MVRDKKFTDEFWDSDYIGTQGFDILVRKMKDGYKMCQDVENFMKQRAKCEEDYGKSLMKLAKSNNNIPETGSLRKAWDEVKSQVEKIGQEHLDAAKQYSEEATRTAQFAEQQRGQRKTCESVVSTCIKNKKELYKKVLDCKRTYDSKCRDSETQETSLNAMRQNQVNCTMKQNEWEKLVRKEQQARSEAEAAEKSYKDTLQALENVRIGWKSEMMKLCQVFEDIEEVRIMFLRNKLWEGSNICSQICVEDDNHAESMRKMLETCNADTDITDFIYQNRVGSNCPGKILFQPYISNTTNQPWRPKQVPDGPTASGAGGVTSSFRPPIAKPNPR